MTDNIVNNFDEKLPEGLDEKFDEILNGTSDYQNQKNFVDPAYEDNIHGDEFLKEEDVENNDEKDTDVTEEIEGNELEDDDTVESPEAEADDGEYDYIPDNLVAAGRAAGFTDAKIIKMAEEDIESLEALANFREQILSGQQTQRSPAPTPQPVEEKKPSKMDYVTMDDVDLTDMDENSRKIFKNLLQGQNALIDKLNDASEELFSIQQANAKSKLSEQEQFDRRIDSFFDKIEAPELGHSSYLTPEQETTRKEIYGIAAVLTNANRNKLEDNLDKAVSVYSGMYNDGGKEKEIEDKIVEKLNKQKTKFTPRPGGQKKTRKFKNDDERAMAAMEEAARQMGLDLGV